MSDTADGAVPSPPPTPVVEGAAEPASPVADQVGDPAARANRRRRRGSRGGKGRSRTKPAGAGAAINGVDAPDDQGGDDGDDDDEAHDDVADDDVARDAVADDGGEGPDEPERSDGGADAATEPERPSTPATAGAITPPPRPVRLGPDDPDLPDPPNEGRVVDPVAAEQSLVRRPRIGDSRPAPPVAAPAPAVPRGDAAETGARKSRRRGGRGRSANGGGATEAVGAGDRPAKDATPRRPAAGRDGGGRSARRVEPVAEVLDTEALERRRGRERKGRPVGRYLMCVHVRPELTQIAVLEGRSLIEHYVSRPADDVGEIHGNIYMGRVQNVLPGMEAAFVDIGTPKNAVLYRGDLTYDAEDVESKGNRNDLRIEQMLKARQLIVCQVTKNPIGAKGARLTQEVSLPGRFVVLIPNSKTYGISKRLPDDERKRLRAVLDKVKPDEHGVIVRTAAENVSSDELRADVERLLAQWERVDARARRVNSPSLLYREPDMAVRVIREEFNPEYRGVVIDDPELYEEVRSYVAGFNPDLVDRIELYDPAAEGMSIFERHHVHEQLHKALDRKVWLPSGGSLIIEHTEALTVIDVNTGKNVGTTNLEETVYRNNLEAAEEIARQLRLRDIGGIIVIDFIDMEIRENRRKVVDAFREALARDKTRTQVFDISELGLVEMTRKRIGEGLLTNFADQCPNCDGRGVLVDLALLE